MAIFSSPTDAPPNPLPERREKSWSLTILVVCICILVLGLIIYTGISGLEGTRRPKAEGFANAPTPEYSPSEYARVVEVYDGVSIPRYLTWRPRQVPGD